MEQIKITDIILTDTNKGGQSTWQEKITGEVKGCLSGAQWLANAVRKKQKIGRWDNWWWQRIAQW